MDTGTTDTGEQHVLYQRDGPIATVQLNRPDRLNALSEPMKDRLGDLFLAIARDPAVRVVVLRAAGRGFCASGDVSTMGEFTPATAMARLKRAHRWIAALAALDVPVVAAVRGAVAGAGWSMALAADVILASETAKFSQVFKNVGLMPDTGALWFLGRQLGPIRAKELIFKGRVLSAAEAMALDLVTEVVADDTLDARAQQWAEELAAGPATAFAMTKRAMRQLQQPSLEQALEAEASAQSLALLTDDHREGIRAFRERRAPRFGGERA